ncbi:uncharacterized protein LOC104585192 isoform X1 [Brachypodium distachyon]|nr:uncharacterized protein LOC104585192 isoform X1 [Brachypodium distachyon]|eukprot:XP_024318681.1 uncharacterized protein LOC104585192 isoform X1 [Brachypodium distachyon]
MIQGERISISSRLEQETGVSFMPSYLRLLLVTQKWEQAYAYVAGQVDPAAASSMADATLLASPELHPARRVLHTLRSDPFKARIQYGHISRGAVEAVLKWAAKCPELNAKTLSRPRCPFDYTYVVSLGPSTGSLEGAAEEFRSDYHVQIAGQTAQKAHISSSRCELV